MNLKILTEVEYMFHTSPQLLRKPDRLQQTINSIFDIWLENVNFDNIGELVLKIDDAILAHYFSSVWQPRTKKFKYSGLAIITEVNNLRPRRVLDIGCGYNEFKGKIDNLLGIDPYNKNADIQVGILDFFTDDLFDVTIALGSINFGSTNKIFAELEHTVNLCAPGGKMFFRVNPGHKHTPPESRWISFYPWTSDFIINCAEHFNMEILDLRNDSNDRMYFVWAKPEN